MRVLGIIPARGGSNGIPRKNIRLLAGRPLLAYTAEAARKARRLTKVVLSTEDAEIAEVGRQCGLDVPFMRPPELASDDTPTLPVVQHALRALQERGENFDAVCLLQPTNPLRGPDLIDGCIALLEESDADSVITVLPVPPEHNPHWVYFRDKHGHLRISTGEKNPIPRRQDLPPAFHREGSVYVTRCQVVIGENNLYGEKVMGFPVEHAASVNLDSLADWVRAEEALLVHK